MQSVRPIIAAFAEQAMERKLAANDAKKGEWTERNVFQLLGDLRTEVNELADAVHCLVVLTDDDHLAPEVLAEYRQGVLSEAADVALYALFLCDRFGLLPQCEDRGRRLAERPTAVMASVQPTGICRNCGGTGSLFTGERCPCGGLTTCMASWDIREVW